MTVWAPPVSLAATPGILSLPQGTEMFQFPRFPPPPVRCAVLRHHPEGVAPFGYLWITSCQHFPRAFRRVAASFLGCRRQGIHRLPFFADFPACDAAPPSPTRASEAHPGSFRTVVRVSVLGSFLHVCRATSDAPASAMPRLRGLRQNTRSRGPHVLVAATPGGVAPSVVKVLVSVSHKLRFAGVASPRWSRGDSNPGPPPCKGGALPAKLRPRAGGRAWTRTRDLGLIRAAL